MLISLGALAQYTQPNHYYGCTWTNGSTTYDRYGAIEQITIQDASGNVVYNKAGDGCNQQPNGTNVSGGHYNLMTTTPSFNLVAGSQYTMTIGVSNPLSSTIASACGVWIDFNGNTSFAEANEFVTVSGWTISAGSSASFNFTVPCNVTTNASRVRVRTNYQYYPWSANMHSNAGTGAYYGETEDYTMDFSVPTAKVADFFGPDTAYVGTIVNFVNSSSAAFINYWDINNDGSVEYTTRDMEHIFSSAGTYNVKLKIQNCAGSDSIVKQIVIVNPTSAPVADFVATKNVVELFDVVKLIDLSSNGATYWNWYLTNGVDTIDVSDQSVLQGGNPYVNRNPDVYTGTNPVGFPKIFPDRGKWTVCLQSSNSIGSSSVRCKVDYIEVTKTSFNMGPETSLPNNIITAEEGTLYDKGGPLGNYTVPEANLEALIAPCGAQSVTITFKQFKLLSNANLQIYDGVNALGTPLHSGSGFTAGNAPTGSITANTGTLYLLWNSSAGATDSGFIANWTSVAGSGASPVANFDLPADTIYNAVFVDFINTSTDAQGNVKFEWYIDGSAAGFSRHLTNQIFLTNGSHTIKLRVLNCDGSVSEVTKTLWVAHPGSPTELDFVADNQRPRQGDVVKFTTTSDKANAWEFAFFPNTGVSAVAPASPYLKEQSFKFTEPGKYTVQCKGYNVIDSVNSENAVIKANYIIVVSHCRPVVSVTTSTDIAISYVGLEETSTNMLLIDNESATGVDYEDFTDQGVVMLNFGGEYAFEIARESNTNPMTRKIWIDWNVDGDFDDAGEQVASQSSGTSMIWNGSFTVPDVADAFEANTVMRIGVSYGTDPNEACGANSGVAGANRIGEFEDYAVRVVNDGDKPVITLNGNDTVYVEQGSIYVDAGATAWDPSSGDISSRIETTSNVDASLTGIYSVIYCVEDASGNAADCVERTVYVVVDQTAPVITLNGNAVENVEVHGSWTDAGATATDNKDGNLDAAIVVSGEVDVNVLGTYVITYYVQDAQGNGSEVTRTVNVVDTQAPVIDNASADKTNAASWAVEVQLQNVFVDVTSFNDNYNSLGNNLTVTASPGIGMEAVVDTRFKGTTTVTYVATDESGNSTTQVIRYVVEDYIAPYIDLHTLDTVWHEVNTPYNPVDATVSDNLYDNTQVSLTKTSNVNPYTLGTYYDTYTATDASGNVSVRKRTVKVVDTQAPVISGKNGPIVRVGLYSEFAAVDRLVFTDNYNLPASLKANAVCTYTDINTYKVGMYTANFVTRDESGNESAPFTLYVVVSRDELQLGVDELSIEDMLTVAPNPTTGLFTVNVELAQNEDIQVGVYNAMGQRVQDVVDGNLSSGSYVVDLSGNANGFYYVKMQIKGAVITKKVLLNQ